MKNLQTMIKLLYKRVSAQAVIEGTIDYNVFSKKEFLRLANAYIFQYSENEAENLWDYFVDMFSREGSKEGRWVPEQLNVFEPIFHYVKKILNIRNNKILCDYSHLLDWRHMVTELSEDIFVTAFLAKEMTYSNMLARGFSWERVIGHDNAQLNAVVRRGISENHSHLNGAAPIFHISWIGLMNNVDTSRFKETLQSYDEDRRYTNVAYGSNYKESLFYQKYMQAALIRLLLYSKISGKRLKIGRYIVNMRDIWEYLKLPKNCLMSYSDQEPCLDSGMLDLIEAHFQREPGYLPLREIICIVMEEHQRKQGNEEPDWQLLWERNPELLRMIQGRVGLARIPKELIVQTCKRNQGITFSQLFLKFLYLVERVSLEDMQELFRDEKAFLGIWERITLENVKALLQNMQDIMQEQSDIQSVINSFRIENIRNMKEMKLLDYALNDQRYVGTEEERANFIFSGERWLMYAMFRKIYLNEGGWSEYFKLFYAYLLIKESVRSEMVQSNPNVGFLNFSKYQGRKGDFLVEEIYKSEFTKLAVSENLISKNIMKSEFRIAPKSDMEENRKMIQVLDELIDPERKERNKFFYTVHFIKKADVLKDDKGYTYYRHYETRKNIEKQAIALIDLREEYPYIGERILGIDAAANEIGCRPEVFASVFRYLKQHRYAYQTIEGVKKIPQLNATYHVGEDFLDLADGLRAIDEAILFLNLNSGDRLGHALALGIDVKEWYEKKSYRVTLPVQDYLDNLVWVYHKLFQFDIKGHENFMEWIQSEFAKWFYKLYYMNIFQGEVDTIMEAAGKESKRIHHEMNMEIFSYYCAWQLRGDDPEVYEFGYYNEHKYLEKMETYRVNCRYPVDFGMRNIPEIALLYYMYHYNGTIRKEGNKTMEVNITSSYVCAVADIQRAMQKEVAKLGIAIETNPSSNFLIGTFRQYEKHPILQFYNKGLVYDMESLKSCPQLSVSINTDDQGVFNTSLENEYALIARSLESVTDEAGCPLYHQSDIYDWLEQIRIMGNEQSFWNLAHSGNAKEEAE